MFDAGTLTEGNEASESEQGTSEMSKLSVSRKALSSSLDVLEVGSLKVNELSKESKELVGDGNGLSRRIFSRSLLSC